MGIWEIVAEEAAEKALKKERRRSRIEIEKNKAESKTEFVKNLLSANRFTIAEIATFASVSEDFVEKVKKTLN
jgi:hypothetical protein